MGDHKSNREPNGQERVAVVLVTYNAAADLGACLAAVAEQDYRWLELVVVDCGSQDRSVEVARAAAPPSMPCTFEALAENRGFSGGMNAALRHTSAPFVLALNADARPRADFVRHLVARARSTPEYRVGAVTGRLRRPVDSGGVVRLDACGMRWVSTWRHLDRGSGEPDRGQFAEAERVFGGTGAATLYRREALDDVAFPDGEVFDEYFFAYREDAELAFRLQERGWECLYEPAAVAEHRRSVVPSRRAQVSPVINYHSLKNRYLLRAYHQTAANAVRTAVPTLWRDLLALGHVVLRERTSWPAYGWLWRHRRQIIDRRRWLVGRRTAAVEAIERWFRVDALPLSPAGQKRADDPAEPPSPSPRSASA